MVTKYPSTVQDLKRRREHVPVSELKFFNIVNSLNDKWHVWHSINWDKKASRYSGEADYLIFHPQYGYIVMEVKGGIISVKNGDFYTTNQKTMETHQLDRSPFDQAKNAMHYIRDFYETQAKKQENCDALLKSYDQFPFSFSYGVFFPDTPFKNGTEYIQFPYRRIFDEVDYKNHKEWMDSTPMGPSPLERYFIKLLDEYKRSRVIMPKGADFFIKMIGSNISRYVNLRKYLDIREGELDQVNRVQDFLLNALSNKKRCIFEGSAGSGKTFIAMKRAMLNYKQGLKTLFLCFNTELRDSIKQHLSEQLNISQSELKNHISVYSIHSFLSRLIRKMFDNPVKQKLLNDLHKFSYERIGNFLRKKTDEIPESYKFNSVLVDEAQDIDSNLWESLESFMNESNSSYFYVFYDGAQAIFIDNFSPQQFDMNKDRDLIVLSQNLRNSIEIAKFLEKRAEYGNFQVKYERYSGVDGFKISVATYSSASECLKKSVNIIKKKYFDKEIGPERVIILAYNKLQNIAPKVKSLDFGEFVPLVGSKGIVKKKIFLVEPNNIADLPKIKKKLDSEWIILFKTITAFKGLERDVIFLIIPKLTQFKERYEYKYENFIKQIYVGASRAKFKLYFFEYEI